MPPYLFYPSVRVVHKRNVSSRSRLLLAALVTCAFASAKAQSTAENEIDRYVRSLDTRALLGQALAVGYEAGTAYRTANNGLKRMISDYGIGTIILYHFNLPNQDHTPAADVLRTTAVLTDELQQTAFTTQPPSLKIPLLIAIDQEGGFDMRLTRGVTRVPSEIHFGATRDENLAQTGGWIIGTELRALGINANFSPVADINISHKNDLIGRRAFGSTAQVVTPLALAWMRGLQSARVLAIAKHFPGHGTATTDPHYGLADMGYATEKELRENDAIPFAALAKNGVDGIMTSHMSTPLDSNAPVTISAPAINYLRRDLAFGGLVVTDDIVDMMGILMDTEGRVTRSRHDIALQALTAGHDVVVFGCISEQKHNPLRTLSRFDFDAIFKSLTAYFDRHPADRQQLQEHVKRVLRAKARVIDVAHFGEQKAWMNHFDLDQFQQAQRKDNDKARGIAEASVILLTEDGRTIHDSLTEARYFGQAKAPLQRNQLITDADTVLLVSPVHAQPDELSEALSRTWVPRDHVRVKHIFYGWRSSAEQGAAQRAWGEPVRQYSSIDSDTGTLTFDQKAIDASADEILRDARDAKLIVFGVMTREHIEVLSRVCSHLQDERQHVIVLLFKEPYFLQPRIFKQRNISVVWLSPWPSVTLGVDVLLGNVLPKPADELPIALDGFVNRPHAPAARSTASPQPQRTVPRQSTPPQRARFSLPPVCLWGVLVGLIAGVVMFLVPRGRLSLTPNMYSSSNALVLIVGGMLCGLVAHLLLSSTTKVSLGFFEFLPPYSFAAHLVIEVVLSVAIPLGFVGTAASRSAQASSEQ